MRCALLFLAACGTSDDIVGPFTGPEHRYVVDEFRLPYTSAQVREVAGDLDGDGLLDNQVGALIATWSNFGNVNMHTDDVIAAGVVSSFVLIQADDLENDPTASVRYFGADGDAATLAGGRFESGAFRSNRSATTDVPGAAVLRLPVFMDASPSVIELEHMEVDLRPDGAGGYVALIHGVFGEDIYGEVAGGVHQMIEADPQAHGTAILLLDANRDGIATPSEIEGSNAVQTLLAPDVDFDGRRLLSFGFALHLKPCDSGTCVTTGPDDLCFDRVRDGDETDIDCGGSCKACPGGAACTTREDCQTAACAGVCAEATCSDGVLDGYETDLDCGWNCSPCAVTKRCRQDADCATNACRDNVCR